MDSYKYVWMMLKKLKFLQSQLAVDLGTTESKFSYQLWRYWTQGLQVAIPAFWTARARYLSMHKEDRSLRNVVTEEAT